MGMLKKTLLVIIPATLFMFVSIVSMPHSVSANAGGGGGGGGTSGCAKAPNTCFGAVWRYRTTTSNSVQIPNVKTGVGGGGYTTITNCATTGGYFEYVLPTNSADPDTNNNDVRSWKIGTNAGSTTYRSEFFGGDTNYRVSSSPGDVLPATLTDGKGYSWYAVENAFNTTVALKQNNGYSWNGSSTLEWFCWQNANYNLTPTISTNPSAAVTAGGTVDADGVVKNAGPTSSNPTNWQISEIVVPKGQAAPTAGGDSSKDPKSFFGSSGFSTLDSGTNTFAAATDAFNPRTAIIPDNAAVGTKFCFVLSVQGYNQSTTDWRHSVPSCVVVAKQPSIQIIGGDLRVGAAFVGSSAPPTSAILTSITIKDNKSYGSWDEYGIAATGTVTGLASGSALAGGLACTGSTCATNTLTFANAAAPIGNYSSSTSIPDIASSFPITSSTPQYAGLGDAAQQRIETGSGTITIGGGTIPKGNWLVINAPTATVNITGNINYDPSALSSISDIPQLVIIANNINIAGNVTNVDAWLVASGTNGIINTCSDVGPTAALTTSICSNALLVNGPVMAKQLYLRRTYGSDGSTTGDPAETFNLRPDAYLWATYQASKSARLETTYSEELPPRF
jgi:hypothetical protein